MNHKNDQRAATSVVLAILAVVWTSSTAEALDQLEMQIDRTIREACYGYLPEMLPDALSEFIYENSATCREIEVQGGDVERALVRVGRSKLRDPARWAVRDRDVNIAVPCNSDFMCSKIRKAHESVGTPVSQRAYDRVKAHCETEYHCIERWFEGWPQRLPGSSASRPAEATEAPETGLSFDDLMEGGTGSGGGASGQRNPPKPSSGGLGDLLADEMGGGRPRAVEINLDGGDRPRRSTAYDPQLTLDGIHAARSEINVDNAVDTLKRQVTEIMGECQCLDTGRCFRGPSFEIDEINDSLRSIERDFAKQKSQLCNSWLGVSGNLPRDLDYLGTTSSRAGQSIAYLGGLDASFEKVTDKHRAESKRIAEARAAAENSGGGFQFGKLAALGVGAAIGGIGNLDSATQLELISGMVADSMEGVEGVDNFKGSASSSLSRLAPPPAPRGPRNADSGVSGISSPTGPGGEMPMAPGKSTASGSGSNLAGSYAIRGSWERCVTLNANGTLQYWEQTLVDWNNPTSGYAWNQVPISGSWTAAGNGIVRFSAEGNWKRKPSGENYPAAVQLSVDSNKNRVSGCPQ